MYMGSHEMILNVGVQFKQGIHVETVHRAVHRIEDAITAEFPQVRNIYIEVESLPRVPTSA